MRQRMQDAAGCAVVNERGEVLLVHQTYGARLWEVPGGVVEPGEAAWDAARRECREEIGAEPLSPHLCGIYFLPERDAYVFIFRADDLSGAVSPDGDEIDGFGWFPLERLPAPIASFTVERLRDAVSGAQVALRVQQEPKRSAR